MAHHRTGPCGGATEKDHQKKKILTVKILFEEKRLQKLKFLVQRQ